MSNKSYPSSACPLFCPGERLLSRRTSRLTSPGSTQTSPVRFSWTRDYPAMIDGVPTCWPLTPITHTTQAALHGAPASPLCCVLCMWVLSPSSRIQLCDPMACSQPGSSVHGILQARILGWVAMPSSRGSSWPRDRTHISLSLHIGRKALYH